MYLVTAMYICRIIAAKCAKFHAISRLGDEPIQLEVGVSGGCEMAVHATRRFINSMPKEFAIANLNFANAFNNLHRDAMLEAVFKTIPVIYKYGHLIWSTIQA